MAAQLRPCSSCGHMVAPDAKTCPSCGTKKPARKKRTPLQSLGIILVVGLPLGIFLGSLLVGPYDDLGMVRQEWTQIDGFPAIVGTLRNAGDEQVPAGRIVFDLFTASGAQAGLAMAAFGTIAAGDTVRFEASVLNRDAVSSRFAYFERIRRE